jgi:methenyltetrahydromethanopterin cyclohydrolase
VAGGRLLDFGVEARAGMEAGVALARVCMADLAHVSVAAGGGFFDGDLPLPWVEVRTDHPVAACLASQYAGWAIQVDDYFAMGSGPMRAAYGGEDLFDSIGMREDAKRIVGVLETRALPSPTVVEWIADKARVDADHVDLLVAPTASTAGGLQIVARSVETALHKLHEVGFDLGRIVSGWGRAPLPPVARDDLAAIGRTNDAILYGATVWLWVQGDDESLEEIGPRVPSSSSGDYGSTFSELFERYDRDFYKLDPMLFSPARIVFQNIDSGKTQIFGRTNEEVLRGSFFGL